MYDYGYCEICGKYELLRVFELTSFDTQPLNTSNTYVAPKKRVIYVCNRCYQGLINLRSGNMFNKSTNF